MALQMAASTVRDAPRNSSGCGPALLRRVTEAGVDLPVVLFSAFAGLATGAGAGALGAAAFLDKPVAMETSRRLVHLLARGRRRRVRGSAHAPRRRPWRRFGR